MKARLLKWQLQMLLGDCSYMHIHEFYLLLLLTLFRTPILSCLHVQLECITCKHHNSTLLLKQVLCWNQNRSKKWKISSQQAAWLSWQIDSFGVLPLSAVPSKVMSFGLVNAGLFFVLLCFVLFHFVLTKTVQVSDGLLCFNKLIRKTWKKVAAALHWYKNITYH